MSTLKNRLAGLAACLAILLIAAGIPVALLIIGAVPNPGDITWVRLTAPDDGGLALVLISAVAWLAWAVIVVSLVAEAMARLRGVRSLRIPGLAVPQLAAGRLMAVAALLFVTTPLTSEAMSVPPAAAVPAPPAAVVAPPAPSLRDAHPTATQDEPIDRAATVRYTVKRGDSLWKIAQEHLGDGTRFREIVALNQAALDGQPDFIAPGLVLHLPDEGPLEQKDAYVVQRGDTLSEIAERELGDADEYPALFTANRKTVQSDGRTLEDPDLILPGWELTMPATSTSSWSSSEPGPRLRLDNDKPEPSRTDTSETAPHERVENHVAEQVDETGDSALPGWVLPGLSGAGAVLAGSLLIVLRQHRRTQLRYRRPGQVIAPPPRELRQAEKSAHAAGSVTAPRIGDLDRALRALSSDPSPRLMTAALSSDRIWMTLAETAELDPPWRGSGTAWEIRVSDVPPTQTGQVPPYPLLVSVGQADDGSLMLLNLEEFRSIIVTGDRERGLALGRHLAAELALNPWSMLVEVEAVGVGGELATIDPLRLHHHPAGDTAFLEHLARTLESEDPGVDPDQFRCLIAASEDDDGGAVQGVAKIVTSYPGRPAAAVVSLRGNASEAGTELHLSRAGRLRIPKFDLDLAAAGLTPGEAQACAALVDITSESTNAPVPAADSLNSTSGPSGALAPALTEPRPDGPAGERSLLPKATHDYELTAATLADDVRQLAPVASPAAEERVAAADPDLDEDLARWDAPALVAPKLTLLGPVNARAGGDAKKSAHRRPYYVELLAFLTLHPSGATALDLAEAFGIQPERARNDLSILRAWLGKDPRTGQLYLPNARQTHESGVPAIYRTHGVLCDMDLFRRLRTRGMSRGADGMEDLIAALRLVSGEPFSALRDAGWGWLLDGERLDHVMTCAIVDVGHLVTVQALSAGDLDLAEFAAQTAYVAAPYDETPQLDLIEVDHALGRHSEAGERLRDRVSNRSDDGLGPIDLPPRSAEVMRQRGWKTPSTRSAG